MTLPTSGLELWFDASQEGRTIAGNALPIPDISGNSRDGEIEGSPVPPPDITWQPSRTPTGLPAYRNTGPRGITSGNDAAVFHAAEGITLLAVHSVSQFVANGATWWLAPESSPAAGQARMGVNDSGMPYVGGRQSSAVNNVNVAGPSPLTINKFYVQIGVINYLEGRLELYLDGVKVAEGALETSGAKSSDNMRLYWFGRANVNTGVHLGDIAENAAWSRTLSPLEIKQVSDSLIAKHIGEPPLFPPVFRFITEGVTPKLVIGSWAKNATHITVANPTIDVIDSSFNSVIGGPQAMTVDGADPRLMKYEHGSNIFARGNPYFLIFGGEHEGQPIDETIHPIRF